MTSREPAPAEHGEASAPTENTSISAGDLKALLQKLSAAAVPEAAAAEGPKPLPQTDPAYRAALADTFEIEELETDPERDDVRAILAQTEMVMVGGRRRLRLADDARGKFLSEVQHSEPFQRTLRELHEKDNRDFDAITDDPVRLPSAWLRRFLIGKFGDVTKAPAEELRAAVSALERLEFFPLASNLPSLAGARRLLSMAELLEPLRILIGASGGWDGSPVRDRFVGRERELRTLRSFVDELESEDVSEAVSRTVRRFGAGVGRAVTGRSAGVMVWEARGGLGKTALIAKFVLDHALGQTRPFPFAYLDFDRGTLQPRDPRLLLVEVAGQIGLQFQAVGEPLSELRRELRAEIVDPGTKVHDPFGRFRSIVREHITFGRRAFLLVLDTMEVVQYDRRGIDGVAAFVDLLYDGGFPELRVVAAGRADVPELRRAKNTRATGALHKLGPLSVSEAAGMAERLGQELLGNQWRPGWAQRSVGKAEDPPQRREPLSIRVAVELLRGAESDLERDRLSLEIEKRGEDADTDYVAALYEQRVLKHVRDPDVRALAWPGLVLRQVTREMASDLLAPLCGLTPERAAAAFDGLAREVWIVERSGRRGAKDEVLVHRADLRTRTLPLMRKHNSTLFDEVNDAAIRYYQERRDNSLRECAEWFYHRLLRGDPPESLESDWRDELGSLLAGAEADLRAGSDAANFLAAMTSPRLIPAADMARLPPRLALEHLARTAPHCGAFDDNSLNEHLIRIRLADAMSGPLSPIAEAAAATLTIKTGQWHQIPAPSSDPGPWRDYQDYAMRFLRARDFAGGIEQFNAKHGTPADTVSRLVVGSLTQDLAVGRLFGFGSFEEADGSLARILADSSIRLTGADRPLLRLVMVFGEHAFGPAVERWLEITKSLASEKQPLSLSLEEIRGLSSTSSEMQKLFGPVFQEAQLLERARELLEDPQLILRFESPAIPIVLSEAVSTLRVQETHAIRRFAAARHEDWLVPIAYAAARITTEDNVPPQVTERIALHDPASMAGWLTKTFRRTPNVVGDTLQLLRRADEAGDLAGTASLFLDQGEGIAAEDLKILLFCLTEWRKRIGELLSPSMSA